MPTAVSYTHLDVYKRQVIIHLRLAGRIELLSLGNLPLKPLFLVDGVIQLTERIAELGRIDEILKPLGKRGILRLALGQRADLHRVCLLYTSRCV